MRNIIACCMVIVTSSAFSQEHINNKAYSSLKKLFGDSVTITREAAFLTSDEHKIILKQVKIGWTNDSVIVFRCNFHDSTIGYGFVDNVKSKTQLITYLVSLTPIGEVKDVDVLVYRESYGGEIAYESFRKQFRQKTVLDELRPGKDIKNISGATISVRAISQGVKKILATYDVIRNKHR